MRFEKRHADLLPVSNAKNGEAFALALPSGLSELWVHVDLPRRRYYDIWCRFMLERHGLRYRSENQNRFQLDHAYNLAAASRKADASYVLLTAIDRSVNASWGYVERMLSCNGMGGNRVQLASWLSMPKLLGIRAPSFAKRAKLHDEFERMWSQLLEIGAVENHGRHYYNQGMDHFESLVRHDYAGRR